MNTYEKAVAENMAHMQTSLADWQAVLISGFSDATDSKGNAVKMPTFEFPAGYTSAPTLYKSTSADCACCELCAHDIKNVYWLQNDSKRWLLAVGSECVTRFAGKSGDEIALEVRDQQNRELIQTLLKQLETIRFCFSIVYTHYGKTQQAWSRNEARQFTKDLEKLLGRIEADAAPAAMAGFITRKGTQARELSEAIQLYLKSKTAVSYAVATLQRKQSKHSGVLSHGRIAGHWATDDQKTYAAQRLAEYQKQIEAIQAAQDCAACLPSTLKA